MPILITIVVAIVLIFVAAVPLLFLWNWLMPQIFGLPEITYWQSWGLMLLSSILFKDNPETSKQ